MSIEVQEVTTTAKFICNICDCVSIGNKGDAWVQQIFQQFNHSNCYVDRTAAKKATPGEIFIKGDGKKNRYVINLIAQFYPSAPKYANDNITKRLEWFSACLDKVLEIPDMKSVAFPPDLGFYEVHDYEDRYRLCINDFRKKYFLRHSQQLTLIDYLGKEIPNKSVAHININYDEPISVLKTNQQTDQVTEPSLEINVVGKFDVSNLFWTGQDIVVKANMAQTQVKIPLKNIEQGVAPPSKFGKSMLDDEAEAKPEVKAKIPMKIKPTVEPTPATEPVKVVPIVKTPIVAKVTVPIKAPEAIKAPEPIKAKIPLINKKVVVPETKTVTIAEIEQPDDTTETKVMPTYEKNPLWTKTISELIAELDPSWDPIFKDPKMLALIPKVEAEFQKEIDTLGDHFVFLPSPPELLFNAFKQCSYPPKDVILGQDPYFANINEAMGLSFSVPDGVKLPPTLVNIYKELETDLTGFKAPKSGNLTQWAQQGVLLLNTALTVLHGKKEAHLKMWKDFTSEIIRLISVKSPTPVVFMLWGAPAKEKEKVISNVSKHLILKATHPSPLGANQGGWFGCKHFSQCNTFLTKNKLTPIDWKL
jgi:uracil-DNA glycosylase